MFMLLLTLLFFFNNPNNVRALSCDGVMHLEDQNYIFNSPDYPTSLPNDTLTCTLKIEHVSLATTNNAGGNCQNDTTEDDQNNDNSDNNVEEICQVRLDFLDFDLQPPILGNCHYDKMWVTANGKYPLLCGHNTGQHMYLDVSGKSHTELTFALDYLQPEFYSCPDRFGFLEANSRQFDSYGNLDRITVNVQADDQLEHVEFDSRRAWSIQVTQIPCGCSSSSSLNSNNNRADPVPKAPSGCLQFYDGISGDFKSFNYDSMCCYSHDYVCNANQLHDCAMNAGYTGHFNNLDYSVCIKEEYGFCGIEYYPAKDELGSFSMTNKTEFFIDEDNKVHTGASNGDDSCITDYLVLPGGHCKEDVASHYSTDRFCGNQMGFQGISQPIVQYTAPFILQVVTDHDELTGSVDYMNRGFHLHYQQIPCR